MLDQPIEYREAVRSNDKFVVVGVEMLGDAPRVLELVKRGFVEPDRERLHGPARRFGHQSDDDAGIYAARQEGAERNVADHVRTHGIGENLAKSFCCVFVAAFEWFDRANLPVLDDRRLPVLPPQEMAWRQLSNRGEERAIPGGVKIGQVMVERLEIDLRVDNSGGNQ